MIIPFTGPPSPEQIERAKERVEMRALLDQPGWKNIEKQLQSGIAQSLNDLAKISTADANAAIDALRKWQLRHKDYESFCAYVNGILAMDDEENDDRLSDHELLLREALQVYGRADAGTDPTANPADHPASTEYHPDPD